MVNKDNNSRVFNKDLSDKVVSKLRGSEGKIYICPGTNCNFREKESQFKKRFDKNGKVNKKEVNKIMKQMKKEAEEDINNPFAALLKDFK